VRRAVVGCRRLVGEGARAQALERVVGIGPLRHPAARAGRDAARPVDGVSEVRPRALVVAGDVARRVMGQGALDRGPVEHAVQPVVGRAVGEHPRGECDLSSKFVPITISRLNYFLIVSPYICGDQRHTVKTLIDGSALNLGKQYSSV
jgi:hypothetical protein